MVVSIQILMTVVSLWPSLSMAAVAVGCNSQSLLVTVIIVGVNRMHVCACAMYPLVGREAWPYHMVCTLQLCCHFVMLANLQYCVLVIVLTG